MHIIIKILKGDEITLQVEESTTIMEIKMQIEGLLNYPAVYQKIILNGRPLVDENKLNFYPTIKDGSKLMLLIKKPDPLRTVMIRNFRKAGFTEQQSERLTNEFMKDFDLRVKQLSLDDIERIATNLMKPNRFFDNDQE